MNTSSGRFSMRRACSSLLVSLSLVAGSIHVFFSLILDKLHQQYPGLYPAAVFTLKLCFILQVRLVYYQHLLRVVLALASFCSGCPSLGQYVCPCVCLVLLLDFFYPLTLLLLTPMEYGRGPSNSSRQKIRNSTNGKQCFLVLVISNAQDYSGRKDCQWNFSQAEEKGLPKTPKKKGKLICVFSNYFRTRTDLQLGNKGQASWYL